MNNYLDEYSMRQASIFELRNIAREMGVNSPTIYKKETLIEKILKIVNGEEKPQMPKSRQGRPPKNLNSHKYIQNNTENFVSFRDYINSQESLVEEKKYDLNTQSYSGFSVLSSPSFVYGEDSSKNKNPLKFENEKGYFFIASNDNGYIFEEGRTSSVDNVVYVPENYINAYNLKSGDFVDCGTKMVSSTNTKFLASINSIDNINEIRQERPDFDDFEIENKRGQIICENISTGTRNVFLTTSLRTYSNFLSSILNSNLPENTVIVNLCLDALPEEVFLLKNKENFENFYTLLGDSDKQNNITVNLAISRVKRLAELNKNVIFVVNEVRKIIKYQNFILGYNVEDLKYKSLETCYSIHSLARTTKLGNSVTVCSLLKINSEESSFVNYIKGELDNMNCIFHNK